MNGHVFQCYEEQDDRRQFAKTFEMLKSHVKKSLKFSEDLSPLFAETMVQPTIDLPTAVDKNATEMEKMISAEEVKDYVRRGRTLKGNLSTVYAVIWGQCSEAMRDRVKSMRDHTKKAEANDCLWLLKQVKSITLKFDEKRDVFISLLDARTRLMNCRQQQGQSADQYLEVLRGWAETIEYHKGIVAENYELVPDTDDKGNKLTVSERTTISRERTLAILYIRGADPTRYGTLITELANMYAMGKNEYPVNLSSALSLLVTYKTPTNARERHPQSYPTQPAAGATNTPVTSAPPPAPETSALTFAQRAALPKIAGSDGVTHDGITCYACQSIGHYSNSCPGPTKTQTIVAPAATTLTQYAYMMAQADQVNVGIDPNWILLDSQSTISIFCNPAMLSNIRKSDRVLRAITNGGHQDSDMVGDFPNLGEVWYNEKSIANILSLAEVRKVCRVTMDSLMEPAIHVHRLDGTVMKFVEHGSGLYVYQTNAHSSAQQFTNYTMVSTVADQKKFFSRRQIQSADLARDLYRKLGRPSDAEFLSILRSNLIRNCPVTPDDANCASIIYGPDIATLKGTTTRTAAAAHVPTFIAAPIPAPILEHHANVTLCVDFFCTGHRFSAHHFPRHRFSHG